MKVCMTNGLSWAKKLPYAPTILLASLMVIKALLIVLVVSYPATGLPNGDALDYVAKSRSLWHEGRLDADTRSFRPLGYSFFLAPLLIFGDDDRAINVEGRALNTVADIFVCLFIFLASCTWIHRWLCRMAAALIIGVQPWTAAYVHAIVPDHVASCLLMFGMGALALSVVSQEGTKRRLCLLLGSALLSITFLVRPEMIIFSAFLICCAIAMKGFSRKRLISDILWVSLPFLLAISCEVCYRVHVGDGFRIFGKVTPRYSGVRAWIATWAGEEQIKHAIVFGWYRSRGVLPHLPANAFDNESERVRVYKIMERIRRTGQGLTLEEDKVLQEIADERIARSPWRYYVGVRLYDMTQYLLAIRTAPGIIINSLNKLPLTISRAAKGVFFVLKILIVAMFLVGCARLLVNNKAQTSARPLLLLAVAMVCSRLLFLFCHIRVLEIRYFVVAWPSLLMVSLYGLDYTCTLVDRFVSPYISESEPRSLTIPE